MTRTNRKRLLLAVAPVAALAFAGALRGDSGKGTEVSLCDGESKVTLADVRPGEAMAPARAQQAADEMLAIWAKTQDPERWQAWQDERALVRIARAGTPDAQATTTPAAATEKQPTKWTARDKMLWQREEKKWVDEGYKAFHNAQALGGTIGISCDMCHPDASNTHPETYPKYQMQLKKTALLRDMINWCIENPMKGKPLPEDDPTLRAVEAYIMSARKGVAMEPGKH